jgi:hypothetical protein
MSALARAQRRNEEQQAKGELPDYIQCQVLRQLNEALISRLKEQDRLIANLQEKMVKVDPDLSPLIEKVMEEDAPRLIDESLGKV